MYFLCLDVYSAHFVNINYFNPHENSEIGALHYLHFTYGNVEASRGK
jgi:hypothetical protein